MAAGTEHNLQIMLNRNRNRTRITEGRCLAEEGSETGLNLMEEM